MCFFPTVNTNFTGLAWRKGVHEFDCGACPECLRKRANVWALRSVYEAREHVHNCMVTLTYDNFVRDDKGHILGETPVNPYLEVNKRDIQLFIKRLRKWWSTISSEPLKYICGAEYGSRTHRAHYHLILFGVHFPDYHFYKKSKRGNLIYMSNILTNLWQHGICTIDSINVNSAIARYCTKYCAKTRSDNTFMLFSQRIGLAGLLRDFNGINYMIDGREYPVPRVVWQEVIMSRYSSSVPLMNYRYINRVYDADRNTLNSSIFEASNLSRSIYRAVRDSDEQYNIYLDYWRRKGEIYSFLRPPLRDRIILLPDDKYHFYKEAALRVLDFRKRFIPVPAPNSNCFSAYEHYKFNLVPILAPRFCKITCRAPSRLNTASDTKKITIKDLKLNFDKSPFRPEKYIQISLDI